MTIVYHGSDITIERPRVDAGRPNLDFGQAFYVTTDRTQAEKWAKNVALRSGKSAAIVNIYELDREGAAAQGARLLTFDEYDRRWLDFIADCRQGGRQWTNYDLIEGGVANDRVIDTVEAYIEGLATVETALGLLARHRPNNQIAIVSQWVADGCLDYKQSIIVNTNTRL